MLTYFLIGIIFLASGVLPAAPSLTPVLEEGGTFSLVESVLRGEKNPPQKVGESLGVVTTSSSVAVYDVGSGASLFQKDPEKVLPLASLTKLMTALVFLENNPGFEKSATISASDNTLIGAKLHVPDGEALKVVDLFFTSLTGSANNATQALVHSTGLSGEEFVEKMNQKAEDLGLKNTHFVEPTGLSEENVSTARDIFIIAREAFANEWIQKATSKKTHEMYTLTSNEYHNVRSQNEIFDSYLDVVGSKTGFTYEAGYCLVTEVRGEAGQEVIAVVLGSVSENSRFSETKALSQWAFENYQWE